MAREIICIVTLTFKQIKALAAEIDAHYAGVSANECRHGVPLDWNCNACADSGKDPRNEGNARVP